MKSDRRFPNRGDLKGKTKDRVFELTVVVDISGSMFDEEILQGLNEIHHICITTNTTMNLIQIDSVVHNVEKFTTKTKIFKRVGNGGTFMEPAIDYIRENKIQTDGCIFITDGWIEDVSRWRHPPKYKVIFLVTTEKEIPGIEKIKRYKQYNLKVQK